jgi:hypothetical protein
MTNQKKIELINSLHSDVVDYECIDGVCLYVYVPLNNKTRTVLKQLGKDDHWININVVQNNNDVTLIDLTPVGFEFANWWDSINGFCAERRLF